VIDPDFAENRLVYVAYAQGTEEANRTAIWRARLEGDRLVGGRVIFQVGQIKSGSGHPGGRMLFLPDGTLLLTVGDGFTLRDAAQDMRSHLGKVLRLTRDGRAPPDNPFIGRSDVLPEIWSSGHRNIQGLVRDPATGTIWAHEHGPRGGDELNALRPGADYGWPAVTHGIDYDGTIISERAFAREFEPARFFWAPSIAPSGLAIYRGAIYPGWDGRFFVGGLASRSVVRLRIGADTGLFVEEQRMFSPLRARIRDIRTGPDGYLYILTDAENGELWRLRPRTGPAEAPPPQP
jgi:glucose/arabinose dehydrogenase